MRASNKMQCRMGCGACCIAPSISSVSPKMPHGKPAGVRCLHLTNENSCELFNQPTRPKVCSDFKAMESVCGSSQQQAMDNLIFLEAATSP